MFSRSKTNPEDLAAFALADWVGLLDQARNGHTFDDRIRARFAAGKAKRRAIKVGRAINRAR